MASLKSVGLEVMLLMTCVSKHLFSIVTVLHY